MHAHVLAVHMHTEALAGRGETRRWMSAAAGASGDRVLASLTLHAKGIVSIAAKPDRVYILEFEMGGSHASRGLVSRSSITHSHHSRSHRPLWLHFRPVTYNHFEPDLDSVKKPACLPNV